VNGTGDVEARMDLRSGEVHDQHAFLAEVRFQLVGIEDQGKALFCECRFAGIIHVSFLPDARCETK
jgi:hypothetical protein